MRAGRAGRLLVAGRPLRIQNCRRENEQPTDGREAVEGHGRRLHSKSDADPRAAAAATEVSPPQSQPDKVKGTLLPPGAFAPLLLDACGCGAHAALLEKAQIDDDILFDTITFEDLQAAGLPSLDARRVIARLEQLKAPSKSLEHSFPPLSNGKVAPPVKEEAGWSQVAKPVVPEAVYRGAPRGTPCHHRGAGAGAGPLAAREAEEAARQEEAGAGARARRPGAGAGARAVGRGHTIGKRHGARRRRVAGVVVVLRGQER